MKLITASRIGIIGVCFWNLLPPSDARAADPDYNDGGTHTYTDGTVHNFPGVDVILGSSADNNTLELKNGTHFQGYRAYIGYVKNDNTLTLDTGGKLTTDLGVIVGYAGSNTGNDATVTGNGSKIMAGTTFTLGYDGLGSNTLSVLNGGVVQNTGTASVGLLASNNIATVSGAGSQWISGDLLAIGESGTASNNQLNVTVGGSVSVSSSVFVGGTTGDNNNSLTISGGSQLSATQGIQLGRFGGDGNTALVTGTLSTLTAGNILLVGSNGNACTLTVSDGAVVSNGTSAQVGSSSDNNVATVTGAGSQWNAGGELILGLNGGAEGNQIVVTAGGAVSSVDNTYVGAFGANNSMTVSAGGQAAITGTGGFYVGLGAASTNNTVTVTGTGSLLKGNSLLSVAANNAAGNTVNVTNGGTLQFNTISNGGAGVVNNTGGVYQFTTNAPSIATATANLTNGTVSYKSVTGADINNAQINNIARSGDNAFRLNNSTNSSIAGYTFDSFANTANANIYQRLELTGGGQWTSTNLTVGNGGAIRAAGSNDVVNVTGTFTITRAANIAGDFDLVAGKVLFSGDVNHNHLITGADLGATVSGLTAQNFTYGTLAINSADDEISLYSGNAALTNGLYVTTLDLLGSVANVANLHAKAGITVYYLPGGANAYLLGNTYQLTDSDNNNVNGGFLVPIEVPEPTATALMGLGGAGLLARRRRAVAF